MTQDDDQVWLEALAGRPAAGEGAVASEAQELRAGILAREIALAPPVPVEDARREAALLARARRDGLIPGRHATPPAWWVGWRGVLTFAAAASVVLAIGLMIRPGREPEVVRGSPGGIARLESDTPEALQRTIIGELRAAGVEASGYERLGRFGIDADLPSPLPASVAEVLRRHGLPIPSDGILTLEIAPRNK